MLSSLMKHVSRTRGISGPKKQHPILNLGSAGEDMKLTLLRPFQWALPASLLASAPFIVDAGDGPYIGVEGGLNWESPQDYRSDGRVIDQLHFNRGWDAGLVGGYSFDSGLRPELELAYRRNNLSHDEFGRGGGYDNADSALANLWYDFKAPTGPFSVAHPYLGGGAGAVRSHYHDATIAGAAIASDYATEFGYQAGAGVGFDVTPRLTLSVDYRHLWTNRGSFHDTFAAPFDVKQRYLADTALLTVRYSFGSPPAVVVTAPPPPLPPPPPVAAAAPPPPPVVVTPTPCIAPAGFQVDANCHIIEQKVVVRAVDFEYNSAQLTGPAQQTLDQVAVALAAQPELTVEIQGYTDSTGPAEYNLRLSQRRAESVREYLTSKGVNGSMLTAHGYGKQNPMASNGTPEGRAQNRRVAFEVTHAPAHVKVEAQAATPASTEAAKQGDPVKTGR
jgi:OmpA-OmpF porin, OOP family